MDSLLKGLFGDQDDQAQQHQAQDFISRFEKGAHYDNIGDDEVVNNYQNPSRVVEATASSLESMTTMSSFC